MRKHNILCVDDEKDNVDALERLFRKKYNVFKATSGEEGLEILNSGKDISLIISDQRMPSMTGVEFLEESMKTHPETIRFLLTGYTDIDSVISAINSGQVYRYITKPWDPVDLANTADKAIERYELSAELKQKNIELNKALDELKTLDEAKNNFMILINHELKTPLTVMLSYIQMLHESELSGEQKTFLNRISQSADRLQQLINDSLELISAETGLMKVIPKKLSAKKIVDEVVKDQAIMMEKKGFQFETSVNGANVKADARVLKSILFRLTENAIKFGDTSSPIAVTASTQDDGQILFSVTNKGKKTLSQQAIDKIMRPFNLDENILNHTKGSGLGLSVCQALLKTHQSHLAIESTKDEFKVSFALPQA